MLILYCLSEFIAKILSSQSNLSIITMLERFGFDFKSLAGDSQLVLQKLKKNNISLLDK